jgi:hypothetical protein
VEAFGLHQGAAEPTPDGWRVRFERQLMQQPVDKVWQELDAAGAVVGGPPPPATTTAEVPSGPVTAVQAPRLLEYGWRAAGGPGGRVRWELATDPAGARILLTQTGPDELADQRPTALAAWQAHLHRLARRLSEAG